MLRRAVSGREDRRDLVGAGDRFRIDHDDPRVHVAEVRHLAGAVGIDGPEMVERHLVAVDVLPAGEKDAPVRQHGGRVVVLVAARDRPQAAAIGIHPVHDGHLRVPAAHPAVAARRAEHLSLIHISEPTRPY